MDSSEAYWCRLSIRFSAVGVAVFVGLALSGSSWIDCLPLIRPSLRGFASSASHIRPACSMARDTLLKKGPFQQLNRFAIDDATGSLL